MTLATDAPGHRPARPDTRGHERGNAMILMPAGVLVMLVLAAIAVDVALLDRTQTALENLAAAVANDVAATVRTGSLFDEDAAIGFDEPSVAELARRRADASGIPGATCQLEVRGGVEPTATATCTGRPDAIFAPAVGFPLPDRLTAVEDVELDNA